MLLDWLVSKFFFSYLTLVITLSIFEIGEIQPASGEFSSLYLDINLVQVEV